MSIIEAQGSAKLPSQTVVNPRENTSAVTLRSGEGARRTTSIKNTIRQRKRQDNIEKEKEVSTSNLVRYYITPPSFPSRLAPMKKEEKERELLDVFCKVEVNIHLLDAIKQVPRYAKFLKIL